MTEVVLGLFGEGEIQKGIWKRSVTLGVELTRCSAVSEEQLKSGYSGIKIPTRPAIYAIYLYLSPFPFGGLYHLYQSANSLLIWAFLPPLPRGRFVPPELFAKREVVRRSRAPMAVFVLAAAPSLTLALGSTSAACDLGKKW